MSDEGLGTDGTIPDHDEGLAAGFDPDPSHFNEEEDSAADDGDESEAV